MTSRALLAFAFAVVAASGVGAAALLDQQAPMPPAPARPTPATPALPPVAPLPPAADDAFDFNFDVDVALDLDAVLADVETAVERSVDAGAIAKHVEQAMQGAKVAALIGGSPRLGIGVRDVTADEARQAGLDGIAGTWVTSVVAESAAARAGLAEGDIIVRVDGQDVRSARHLTRIVNETPAGRTLPVEYIRAGQRAQATVTPETSPAAMARGMRGVAPREFALQMREPFVMAMGPTRGRLGVGVQDLTSQLAQYFGVKAGVLVTQVNDGSPAARAGMKAGDVITRVESTDITRASDITQALAPVEGGATVSVEVMRDRASQSLTVTLDARPTRVPATVRPRGRTAAE